MGSIHPAVGYFGMKTGNFESCSGSVVTAFLLFRQLTLKVGELLLIVSGMTGLPDFLPSDVMNRSVKPKSMPTVLLETGIGLASNSQSMETKYRSARSLLMVMLEGSEGSVRLQRIVNGSLLLAINNWPFFMLKADVANVALCLLCFFLKVGYFALPSQKFLKAVC